MRKFILLVLFISVSANSQNRNLGAEYFKKGEYLKAAKAFENTLPNMKSKLGVENRGYLATVCLTAESYYKAGKLNESKKHYSNALKIYESSSYHKKNFKIQRFVEGYLSVLLETSFQTFLKEEYKNTETILNQCNNLHVKYKLKDQQKFLLYKAYAQLYGKTGDVNLYLDYTVKAIEFSKKVFGEKSNQHIKELANTAVALENLYMYDDALGIIESAFAIFLELKLDALSPLACHLLTIRAGINISLKKIDEAEKDLKLVIEALKKIKDIHQSYRDRFEGSANQNLGYIYYLKGDFQKSIIHYNSSLENYSRTYNPESLNIGNIKLNIANSYSNNSNYTQAHDYYLEAHISAQKNYENIYFGLSESEKFLYLSLKIETYFNAINSFAYKYKGQDPKIVRRVYDNALFLKNQILKSSMSLRTNILSSNDKLSKWKFDEWIGVKKEIATLYEKGDKGSQEKIDALFIRANSLEKFLVSKSETFKNFNEINNKTWKDVQEKLKKSEVAIEFIDFSFYDNNWVNDRHYFALILKPNSINPEMVFLFKESQLSDVLKKNNKNKKNGVDLVYGTKNVVNRELYDLIWKPIEKYTLKFNKVFFSPSGLLNYVSFSALSDGNQFLTNSLNLVRLTTTSKINDFNYSINGLSKASLFGGIEYGVNSDKWQFLNGTMDEVKELSEILKSKNINVLMYSGINATKEELKNNTTSQILHVATHGFFEEKVNSKPAIKYGEVSFDRAQTNIRSINNNKDPLLRSGLVFADANNKDSAILTALEVANLNMNELDLVVLSACETGLGEIKGNEGVYGLQRSFKMAGVEYLIVSLWKVPDRETKEFMVTFYNKLFEIGNIELAFNTTQRIMSEKYDPYYWAAFVLTR